MITDDLKLLICWNCVVRIRQNKRFQNNFPCVKLPTFTAAKLGFNSMQNYKDV